MKNVICFVTALAFVACAQAPEEGTGNIKTPATNAPTAGSPSNTTTSSNNMGGAGGQGGMMSPEPSDPSKPSCDDGIQCTVDTCLEDGTCENKPDNGWCSKDGSSSICDPANSADETGCVPVTPPEEPECAVHTDCDDGVACTQDLCEAGSCTHTPQDNLCGEGCVCDAVEGCVELEGPGGPDTYFTMDPVISPTSTGYQVTFYYTSSRPEYATYEIRYRGLGWMNVGNAYSTTMAFDGECVTFEVRSTDAFGLTDSSPAKADVCPPLTCGDGICAANEDYLSCPQDCDPPMSQPVGKMIITGTLSGDSLTITFSGDVDNGFVTSPPTRNPTPSLYYGSNEDAAGRVGWSYPYDASMKPTVHWNAPGATTIVLSSQANAFNFVVGDGHWVDLAKAELRGDLILCDPAVPARNICRKGHQRIY